MERSAHRARRAIPALAAALAACLPALPDGGAPAPGSAFVVTSDYQSGAYTAVDPVARTAVKDIDVLHDDAVCRPDPLGGRVYVVSRLGADAVEVVDTTGDWGVVAEWSVGAGANPQDIAVVAADRAYVALYEEPALLVVDPRDGTVTGTVDLAPWADADGSPEAAWLLARGDRVYAALQKLADYAAAGPSSILVIDAATGAVQGELVAAAANMYGKLRWSAAAAAIPLVEVGAFGALDGGIQLLDPETGTLSPWIVTEAALGGDLVDAVIAAPTRGYAVIGVDAGGGAQRTRLVAFDPSTGAVGAALMDSAGWHLGFLELDPTGVELWVADRDPALPGVRVFDAASGAELTAAPIDVGLPPFMICFPAQEGGR